MNEPFEILRHSTDREGKTIVDVRGTYFSNGDAIKLRDELVRLLPDGPLLRENKALREALKSASNLEQAVTKILAGGYNGKSKEMHTSLGNSAQVFRRLYSNLAQCEKEEAK